MASFTILFEFILRILLLCIMVHGHICIMDLMWYLEPTTDNQGTNHNVLSVDTTVIQVRACNLVFTTGTLDPVKKKPRSISYECSSDHSVLCGAASDHTHVNCRPSSTTERIDESPVLLADRRLSMHGNFLLVDVVIPTIKVHAI